jgi:hypothetical protein
MKQQKGQALLIAVLLMTVILLVGAIFVAIVIYVQSQSARHGQMRQAKALSDGGIQYADRMLRTGTADWRPPDPPAWCAGADDQFSALDAVVDPSYSGDDGFDPGFWGPDGVPETEDDYYTYEEVDRGWAARRLGDPLPPDPNRPLFADPAALGARGELITRGFTCYPDPRRGTPPTQDLPISVSSGHVLLRVTYDPDPPFEGVPEEDRDGDGSLTPADADPMSNMIRIESIGVVIDEGFAFRRLVAYKPLAITDYVRFVTDKTGTGLPAYLGIPPGINFDGDLVDDGMPERHITVFDGSVRTNTELVLVGQQLPTGAGSTQFHLITDCGPGSTSGSPYLQRGTVEATAGISYQYRYPAPNNTQATVTVTSPVGGTEPIHPSSPQVPGDPLFETWGDYTGDRGPALVDGDKGTDAAGYPRFCTTRSAPSLFDPDPATGRSAYESLTRYSGTPVSVSGYAVNNGEWGHGAGVHVDNATDRQFVGAEGECDINTLMDDWLRNISPTDARAGDSGWNALRSTYAPVGVEIWIVGEEMGDPYDSGANPTGIYAVQADPRSPAAIPDQVLWTPEHVAGEPQIVLRRSDKHWRTATGADSGRYVMVIDHPCRLRGTWPTNQVIHAAGNVRVRGVLPARRDTPAPGPAETAAAVPYWDYNLAIVSGGTAYIDGSILSPADVGTDGGNDDRNTKLAILARDCVCLNPTQIVPQNATAQVSASPDDTDDPRPEASHWELGPEAGARIYTSWTFGAPPASNVYLAAIASGDEPGPSAVAVSFQQATAWSPTPPWLPYVFPGGTALFYFLPPGVLLPGAPVQTPNVSWSLTPEYQPLPDPSGVPAVPWNITPAISTAPGIRNNMAMAWANPVISAGATATWVKKWKIVESTSADPTDLTAIQPAVHCRVNAVMYAERGCWFVIPGDWFETAESIDAAVADDINGRINTPDEQARAAAYLRYNYDIVVNGAITECFTAPVDAVYEWTNKWAYPGSGGSLPSIRYTFDSSVRAARDRGGAGSTSGVLGAPIVRRSTDSANLPRLPLLPVSPDLVYYGESM